MGALDFFKKPSSENVADEHASHAGAQSVPPTAAVDAPVNSSATGDIAAHSRMAAREATGELLQTSPRRRGRPPKSPSAGAGDNRIASASGGVSPEMQAEIDKALEAVYAPKSWAALLGMPADAMAALTGKERWQLSKDERETLGVTGGAAARCLAITNPRGLAILMVSSALVSAYVPRAAMDLREFFDKRAAMKNAASKARKDESSGS